MTTLVLGIEFIGKTQDTYEGVYLVGDMPDKTFYSGNPERDVREAILYAQNNFRDPDIQFSNTYDEFVKAKGVYKPDAETGLLVKIENG